MEYSTDEQSHRTGEGQPQERSDERKQPIGKRVWDRIVRQFESTAVTKRWEEAVLRITQEAHPQYNPQQLQDVIDRWGLLTRGMGVAASTVDIAAASIFTGMWLRGIFRFTPIDPQKHPELHNNMADRKTPGAQWRDNALRQMAYGSPMFGLAGATVAIRPAKLALEGAGYMVGMAGAPVARIVDHIVGRPAVDSIAPAKQNRQIL